ncbi:hypothetical protein ACRCUN_06150 [Mycobacterium sp. LTG2003]
MSRETAEAQREAARRDYAARRGASIRKALAEPAEEFRARFAARVAELNENPEWRILTWLAVEQDYLQGRADAEVERAA